MPDFLNAGTPHFKTPYAQALDVKAKNISIWSEPVMGRKNTTHVLRHLHAVLGLCQKRLERRHEQNHGQRGMSLLEILIALVITTVGLLGFAGLQSRALLSTEDTYVRAQAMTFAEEMLERMRADTGGANVLLSNTSATGAPGMAVYTNAGNWSGSIPTQSCTGSTAVCSPQDMAAADIADLRNTIANSPFLPNGSMLVDTNSCSPQVCVYVAWGDMTASQCAAQQGRATGLTLLQCVVVTGN
jgi:type IV pilus assembly protein PilV